MSDRTVKALLFAVALGLWANVAGTWLRPAVVQAQSGDNIRFVTALVEGIANGTCKNVKICGSR